MAEKPPHNPPRDNSAPSENSLYYKNIGLFSDPYLESLPNTKGDPFLISNWDTFDTPEFSACYEWMLAKWNELKDILPRQNEDQLREKWINPILQRLGWAYQVEDTVQRWGKSQRPDYSLFESEAAWTKAQGCPNRDEGYMKHVIAIAEAKEMGVPLDAAKLNNTNPSFQVISYLVATGKDWGILTDGRYWRLYSTKSKSSYRAYFEVNIEKFLSERDDDQFRYFYNFFRKAAFVRNTTSNQSFLDVVFESGEHYARGVESRLKERAFDLVEFIAQGFIEKSTVKTVEDFRAIYEHSLYYLFRLLFILNCEAKGLLNIHRQSDYFAYSLRALCIKIKSEFETNQIWANVPKSYNYISVLFELLAAGDKSVGIHGFGEEVFSSGDSAFFKKHQIPDRILNQVLLELAFTQYGKKKELRLIDYKCLAADHLGSIFEGLLEYKLIPSNDNKQIILVNSSGERKGSGAYYTPEPIVNYIVRETLGPLTKNKTIDQILKLQIIDPAMGSGHFLLGAVKYLEQVVLTKMNETSDTREFEQVLNSEILHSCINGIDKNPLAVELAKFSLWMYTAKNGHELNSLREQLLCADSLTEESKWKKQLKSFIGKNGFDAVIGNPPWVSLSGKFGEDQYSKSQIALLNQRFGGNTYMPNLFEYFVSLGLDICVNKGYFGYIVPDRLGFNKHFENSRKRLLENSELLTLMYKAPFPEVTVDTLIFVVRKEIPAVDHSFSISEYGKNPISRMQKDILKTTGCTFEFFENLEYMELLKKIESANSVRQLGTICNTTSGYGGKSKLISKKKKNPNQIKTLKGESIGRYETRKTFWFKFCKANITGRTTDKKKLGAKEKILMRKTGDSIIATYDDSGIFPEQSLYFLFKNKTDLNFKYVLGILNSKILNFYYYEKLLTNRDSIAQVKKEDLDLLPIPILDLENKRQREDHEKIVAIVEDILRMKKELQKSRMEHRRMQLEAGVKQFEQDIDNIVSRLFGLGKEELKLIIHHAEPKRIQETAEKKQKKSKKLYKIAV